MKSPLTGKVMPLIRQKQTLSFRKEDFEIYQHYYLCTDSGGEFSTESLQQLNQVQLQNKYRENHGIPYCDEIISIRKSYGLSASKMAEVLGFGINVYRNYENGEVPSISNARLIQMCRFPQNMLRLVELTGNLRQNEYKKLSGRIKEMEERNSDPAFSIGNSLLSEFRPGITNGFKSGDQQLVLKLIYNLMASGPVKLKWLPLLLFLIDFSQFRSHGHGISGLSYKLDQQMITLGNYFGIVHWASSLGICNISVNNEGQVLLLPGQVSPLFENKNEGIEKISPEELTRNLMNIKAQKDLIEITAEILACPVIESVTNTNSFLPYEAAFELNCLDRLNILS